jgi:hypothetical protein
MSAVLPRSALVAVNAGNSVPHRGILRKTCALMAGQLSVRRVQTVELTTLSEKNGMLLRVQTDATLLIMIQMAHILD